MPRLDLHGPGGPAAGVQRRDLSVPRRRHLDGAARGLPDGGPARRRASRHAPLHARCRAAAAASTRSSSAHAPTPASPERDERAGRRRRDRRRCGAVVGAILAPGRRGADPRAVLAAHRGHRALVPRRAGRRAVLRPRRLAERPSIACRRARTDHRAHGARSTSSRPTTRPAASCRAAWLEALAELGAARTTSGSSPTRSTRTTVYARRATSSRARSRRSAPSRRHSFSKASAWRATAAATSSGPRAVMAELRKVSHAHLLRHADRRRSSRRCARSRTGPLATPGRRRRARTTPRPAGRPPSGSACRAPEGSTFLFFDVAPSPRRSAAARASSIAPRRARRAASRPARASARTRRTCGSATPRRRPTSRVRGVEVLARLLGSVARTRLHELHPEIRRRDLARTLPHSHTYTVQPWKKRTSPKNSPSKRRSESCGSDGNAAEHRHHGE